MLAAQHPEMRKGLLVATNYGVLQRRFHDFHGQPAPRTIPTVPGAGVGDVPEVETIGLNGRGSKGSEFSWADLLHICLHDRIPWPHEPRVFFRAEPCRALGPPSPLAAVHQLPVCWVVFSWMPDCIASRRFLASPLTAGLLEETAPQGPHHAPWLHLDAEQDRQTFLLCRAPAFLPLNPAPGYLYLLSNHFLCFTQ